MPASRKKPNLSALAALAAAFLAAGCAEFPEVIRATPRVETGTVQLRERIPAPFRVGRRKDLAAVADLRLAPDCRAVPETVAFRLSDYNPFDPDESRSRRMATVPFRRIFERTLADGISASFFGGAGQAAVPVEIVPRFVGVAPEAGGAVSCKVTLAVSVGRSREVAVEAGAVSAWPDTSAVPDCVYKAVRDACWKVLDCVRDWAATEEKARGRRPRVVSFAISGAVDGACSGEMAFDCGDWPETAAWNWAQALAEARAMQALGISSLDGFRVVHEGGGEFDAAKDGTLRRFRFRAFPYRGFEIVRYDSARRTGICRVDAAYLGVGPEEAYARARRFVETLLSDRGVVLEGGRKAPPAKFKFGDFVSRQGGTVLEFAFRLVE